MQKEANYGYLFLVVGVILVPIYLVAFLAPQLSLPLWLHTLAIEIPVLFMALVFLYVLIRIGWNMITAPPASSLEEQEALLAKKEARN